MPAIEDPFPEKTIISLLIVILLLFTACTHIELSEKPAQKSENISEELFSSNIILEDGTSIRFLDTGGVGKDTLLIVHGWLGSSGNFEQLIDLIPKDIRVIVPDLPGFGDSDKPEVDYSIEFYVEFLSKFIERLELGTVSIAASSMGCIISCCFAVEHPEVTQDLILISPVGLPGQKSFLLALASRKSLVYRYTSRVARKNVAKMVSRYVVADPEYATEELIDSYYYSLETERGREVVAEITYRILGCCRIPKEVFELDKRTLIIFGEHDPMANTFNASDMNLSGENPEISVIPDSAHIPYFEQPEDCSMIITGFLKPDRFF